MACFKPMDLIYFFILCTPIICSRNTTDFVFEERWGSARHLQIKEVEGKVVLSLNFENYFPTLGRWYDGNTLIFYKQFYINDEEVSEWLSEKFTDQSLLEDFLNNLDKHVFELKVDKALLCENTSNLICKIELIRKDFLKEIMIEYSNDIAVLDVSNNDVLVQAFDKVMIKMVNNGFTYSIIFGKEIHQMLASKSNEPTVQETDQ